MEYAQHRCLIGTDLASVVMQWTEYTHTHAAAAAAAVSAIDRLARCRYAVEGTHREASLCRYTVQEVWPKY